MACTTGPWLDHWACMCLLGLAMHKREGMQSILLPGRCAAGWVTEACRPCSRLTVWVASLQQQMGRKLCYLSSIMPEWPAPSNAAQLKLPDSSASYTAHINTSWVHCRDQKAQARTVLTESVTAFPCNWSAWQVSSCTTSWSVNVVAACAACPICQERVLCWQQSRTWGSLHPAERLKDGDRVRSQTAW